MTAPRQWFAAPNQQEIGNVRAGQVVSVRIWAPDAAHILTFDSNGVPPHLRYTADIPEVGTTQTGLFDFCDRRQQGKEGQIVDFSTGPNAGPEKVQYDIDLGIPFVAPWDGQISLVGGAWPAGVAAVPYNYRCVVTAPTESGRGMHVETGDNVLAAFLAGKDQERHTEYRSVHYLTGQRIVSTPTMTMIVPNNGVVKIPLGALSITSLTAGSVTFDPSGNSAAVAVAPVTFVVALAAGSAFALGYLSQGYVKNTSGGTLNLSFALSIG